MSKENTKQTSQATPKKAKLNNIQFQCELPTAKKDVTEKEDIMWNHKCQTSSTSEIEAELHNAIETVGVLLRKRYNS